MDNKKERKYNIGDKVKVVSVDKMLELKENPETSDIAKAQLEYAGSIGEVIEVKEDPCYVSIAYFLSFDGIPDKFQWIWYEFLLEDVQ